MPPVQINSTRQKLALIIGNDNYSESRNKLHNSKNNAQDLDTLLTTIGFHVDLLFDLNKRNMHKHIKTFCKKIKDDDLVLFYFAGHGLQFGGENYLIPVDDNELSETRDVENFGNNVYRILEIFTDGKKSYATIIILDCCMPYVVKNEGTSNMTTVKGFCEIQPPQRTFIQFACAANQTTGYASQSSRNCLFIKHLLHNITEMNVDIREIFKNIVENVYRESDRQQKPLSIDGLSKSQPVYLNQMLIFIPNIPRNATWERNAVTAAGGLGPGSTFNRLHCPKGIFVSRNETIFIADSLNHRIMKYNRDQMVGERMVGKNISGFRSDLLCGPTGIIFDIISHSFIICDYHNRRVLQYSRKRKPHIKTIISNIQCAGIAMDNEGLIYVSDTERHEVRQYQRDKSYAIVVAGGNGQGSRPHQLNYPTYLFVGADQSLYVSDSMNDRIMKWSKDAKEGVVVAGGHRKGSDRTQLNCPTGVVVDRLDTVYVADYWNNRVMRWYKGATYGTVIAGRLTPGNRANQLNGPEGLAFDRNGNLYIADSNNHRIQIFDINTIQ